MSLRMRSMVAVSAFAFAIAACSSSTDNTPGGDPLANAGAVATQYATNVHANYSEALTKAKALQTAIDAFVATPSQATQDAAKAAWVAARTPYSPSEVYRFYGGPIDDENTGPEGALNAWPLDENFIDYTSDDANAGIINRTDVVPQITEEALKGENEKGGEKNISTGYHAIEFLLWGQDTDPPAMKTAGKRPFTDYVATGGTAKNQDRRGQYLKLVAKILVDDLQAMVDAWAPGGENYGKTFQADPKDAVTKMLMGIGSMANAELSGERMTVAYKNRDQEDEHSCFSDTTNADIKGNANGIENVYLGKYGSADGPGLEDLVKAANPALDEEMKAAIAETNAALTEMQKTPFDAAIAAADGTPERTAVLNVINGLKKEAAAIVKIGAALGLTFELEKPSEEL